MEGFIEITGLNMYSARCMESQLPGREITEDMLYHLFSSGCFDLVRVNRGQWDRTVTYDRPAMMLFVAQRNRLEIRRLKAELEIAKGKL